MMMMLMIMILMMLVMMMSCLLRCLWPTASLTEAVPGYHGAAGILPLINLIVILSSAIALVVVAVLREAYTDQ